MMVVLLAHQADYFHHCHSAPVGVFAGGLGHLDTNQHRHEHGFNEKNINHFVRHWARYQHRTFEKKVQTVKEY